MNIINSYLHDWKAKLPKVGKKFRFLMQSKKVLKDNVKNSWKICNHQDS